MTSFLEKKRMAEAMVQLMIKPNPKSKDKTEDGDTKKEDEDKFDTDDKQKENMDIKPSSFGWRPIYSRVDINCDKWLMTMDENSRNKLDHPPSLDDGLSKEVEAEIRYLGCELIQQGAIMLKLPQTAAATGQILFQRFYYQKSFVKYYFEHAVMACLLLASKIEEEPRRSRDIYNVFHRLERLHRIQQHGQKISKDTTKGMKIPLLDSTYIRAKNNMILMERRILATLGFVVHVKHPHRLIVAYCHALGLTNTRTDLMQKAWNYMNDGLRTDIFMRYTPETIACACIFLAARTVEDPIALPSVPFHWFEAFDTSDRDVQAISIQLLKLYSRKRIPNWPRINAELDKLRDAINKEKAAEKAKHIAEKFGKMAAEEKKENNGNQSNSPVREKKRERDNDRNRHYKDKEREKERKRKRSAERDGDRNRDRKDRDRDRRKDEKRDKERRKRSRSRSRDRLKEKKRDREDILEKRYRRNSITPTKSRR